MKRSMILAMVLALGLTAGCATLSPDGGQRRVAELAAPRVKQPVLTMDVSSVPAFVRERLAQPLNEESAVAIALVNNPALKVAYAELGMAEATLVAAGRLPNPGFSFTRYRRGSEREIERKFTFDILSLVLVPLRLDAERGFFAAAQERTALEVVRVADDARRAWVDAVAAAETARYAGQVADAAAAGAVLARQMGRAGNFNRLDQSREELFHAEAVAAFARSRHAAVAARERLTRTLGLWGEDAASLTLPERLPDLPAAPRELTDAEGFALANRLDVAAARREIEITAKVLGLTRATRFLNVLHLGYERDSSNEAPRRTGYEIEVEIPIFDWGQSRNAKAEAIYRQSAARLAETAIRARSEVRESWSTYRIALDLARHYREEIVPLRKGISEESLLRYNGMLIGVFELLADAREQAASVMAAIEATRDFWVADANLTTALMTGSPQGAVAMTSKGVPAASGGAGH